MVPTVKVSDKEYLMDGRMRVPRKECSVASLFPASWAHKMAAVNGGELPRWAGLFMFISDTFLCNHGVGMPDIYR